MTRSRVVLPLLWIAVATATPVGGQGESSTDPEAARDIGLVEQTGRRIAQVDVVLDGKEAALDSVTAEDFVVVVSGKALTDFEVDRICGAAPATIGQADDSAPEKHGEPPSTIVRLPASFLFYFDQSHLTFEGRDQSLRVARKLIDPLLAAGHRVSIVSSGRDLRVFTELTTDRERLVRALDELERSPHQWESFPMQEDQRVADVLASMKSGLNAGIASANLASSRIRARTSALSRSGLPGEIQDALKAENKSDRDLGGGMIQGGSMHARNRARLFQQEEKWRTERALARFSMALGSLAQATRPRAVVYFADTMRSNAGDHYLRLLGNADASREATGAAAGVMGVDPARQVAGGVLPAYDRVVTEAATHETRLYTVKAAGLVAAPGPTAGWAGMMPHVARDPRASKVRFDEARNSLVGLALQSGGRAFVHGVDAKRLAESMLSDVGCFFRISFDSEHLPQDRRVPLLVRVDRAGVDVRSPAYIVLQSESERLKTRLLGAFAWGNTDDGEDRLHATVIPIGFSDGKYRVLVQAAVAGLAPTPATEATWDLGITLISRGAARQSAAGQIQVRGSDVPIIFESEMTMAPGAYEIVAVAHDVSQDRVATTRLSGAWPDPADHDRSLAPVALLQPARGAFSRDGEQRLQGSLGLRDDQAIRTDLPTALVTVACGKPSQKLTAVRRLEGESAVDFAPAPLNLSDGPCAIFSDVIPAGTMTPGSFAYTIELESSSGDVATVHRRFVAAGPEIQAASR